MTFRVKEDQWSLEGRNILDPEKRAAIRQCLERSPIIVEHWYYRTGRSPGLQIFDDMEDFESHLQSEARPGDAFHVWEFAALCRDDNSIATGKYPDTDGCVPEQGAY